MDGNGVTIEVTGYWRKGIPVIVDYGDGEIRDFRIYLQNGMAEWRLCSNIEKVLEKTISPQGHIENVTVQTMSGKVYKISSLQFPSDETWYSDFVARMYGPPAKGIQVTKEDFLFRFP